MAGTQSIKLCSFGPSSLKLLTFSPLTDDTGIAGMDTVDSTNGSWSRALQEVSFIADTSQVT